MLDKIFSKKKKDEDIFAVPERKNNVDLKSLSKLGPKALQQIVEQQQKYISILTCRIEQIAIEHRKTKEKSEELHQKNDLINAQISKMSNQHEQLTIKFDNLQNSLQIMIANDQQQFDSQLNFLKEQFSLNNLNQPLPRTIEQVFTLYHDRFILCLKISQQNKSLKQKIADIELRFDQIKEIHTQAQKEKGLNSLIPSLMESLEELKRERKNSTSLQNNSLTPSMIEQTQLRTKQQSSTLSQKSSMRQAETMTSVQKIQSPKIAKNQIHLSNITAQCNLCKELSQQVESLKEAKQQLLEDIGEWSEKYQSLQNALNQFKGQAREEKEKREKQVRSLKQQIQALEKQSNKEKQQNETLKKQLKESENSIPALREQNQSLLKEIQAKSCEISLKEAEVSNLRLKVSQSFEEENGSESQGYDQNSKPRIQQEKLRQQSLQNQSNLLQILSLKQDIIQKTSQIKHLNSLIQKSQSEVKRMGQCLSQSEQLTNKVETRYQKMMAENEQEMMGKIRLLQNKIDETEKELMYLRNNKLNTQQDMKKMSKERKVMDEAVRELQGYKKDVEERILPTLRQELQSLKKQYKRTAQQKEVMQEHSLQTMSQLNLSYEQVVKEKEVLVKEKQRLQMQMVELGKEIKSRKSETQTFQQMINKLNTEMTDKLLTISKNADQLKEKSLQIDQLYQQLKSKQRKYESQLNQQRIKTETMKRTISVQETKLQENQLSSNKLYEDSIHKDKKINYIELKLKQYKHLIQSLKKEKDEIEKTYTDKINNYQNITEVTSQEEIYTERTKKDKKEHSKSEGNMVEINSNDKDTQYFQNQILSYQESNIVLKEENNNLRQKIKDLEEELQDRKKQVENLQEKRQQTLKQIEKLNLRSVNGSLQPVPSKESIQKEKQFLKEKQQLQAQKQKSQQRTKKVALKAYKGFDILLKKHLTLYKEFMAVFVKELEDREQVKNIQSQINHLVNKSTDMKDVFQDYL